MAVSLYVVMLRSVGADGRPVVKCMHSCYVNGQYKMPWIYSGVPVKSIVHRQSDFKISQSTAVLLDICLFTLLYLLSFKITLPVLHVYHTI